MGDWTGTVPTHTAGQPVFGEDLAIHAAIDTALTAAWEDWSSNFSIGATTTAPTKGSTTYAARYRRLGKTVDFEFKVNIDTGGGWAAGSGTYLFSLPFAGLAAVRYVGSAFVFDSGTAGYPSVIAAYSDLGTSSQCHIYHNTTGTALGSAGPGTAWATGDFILGQITYETA